MSLSTVAILLVTVLVTTFISGIFGMAGGVIFMGVLATLVPVAGRRFFVFHPAWGYFARQYGLRQVSIEHDHKEPSADELGHLIELARSEGATMIVVQPHFSTQAAATVAAALDARLVEADPLARDWDRNLRRFAALLVEGL